MKLITCSVCDDKTPYRKKDYKAHLAKHGNYNKHCNVLSQKIKTVRVDIQTINRDINQLLIDASEEDLVIHEDAFPVEHQDFSQYMLYTVAKHVRNEHNQLQVDYNLLRQFFFMRQYHRTKIERNIEDVRYEREREEEEANSRYWNDPDEDRLNRWRDRD